MGLADDPRQLPDERHDRMAGAGKALIDPGTVEKFEPGLGRDRVGRLLRDDAELGLGFGQGRLDIEPGLPSVLLGIKRADPRIRNPGRSR
jgi:hypothetical protein